MVCQHVWFLACISYISKNYHGLTKYDGPWNILAPASNIASFSISIH